MRTGNIVLSADLGNFRDSTRRLSDIMSHLSKSRHFLDETVEITVVHLPVFCNLLFICKSDTEKRWNFFCIVLCTHSPRFSDSARRLFAIIAHLTKHFTISFREKQRSQLSICLHFVICFLSANLTLGSGGTLFLLSFAHIHQDSAILPEDFSI